MTGDLDNLCHLLAGPPGHVHFVGICGVGMAGLAFQLKQKGWRVSGCDLRSNALAAWLSAAGIDVRQGHDSAHLAGVDWVVRTTAVQLGHPEIQAALARGLAVFQRGMVLAALLRGYTSIVVCGTHGKTTTTAMLTQILVAAGRDPSYCIGGESTLGAAAKPGVTSQPAVAGAGHGDCLVVEADESDGTLVAYAPDFAVVTNVEFDHVEHFADLKTLRASFAAMLQQVRRGIVYCADDPGALELCRGLAGAIAYGLKPTAEMPAPAEWRGAVIEETAENTSFQVWCGAVNLGVIRLAAVGRHNVLNALAACALAFACGVAFEAMQRGLHSFRPVRRRLERVVSRDDVLVISDYAHHPTEIAATLRALACAQRKRWLVVFQPHRYSRTRALGSDFAAVLQGMAELVLVPVYAASEKMMAGGTAWDLYAHIRCLGKPRTLCATSLAQAWGYVRTALQPGDGLLIMGAGDVEKIAGWAREELAKNRLATLGPACAWVATLEHMQWKSAVFERQVSLAAKTTLRVGGRADIFAELADEEDLVKLLQWTDKSRVPITFLGAGSNVLASDLGVRGVVVRLVGPAFRQISRVAARPFRVIVGAGVSLAELTNRLAADGLAGLEFLAGIPGTIGGALRMNAGAWGESIGSRVAWVRLRNPDGAEQVLEKAALGFGYRRCAGLIGPSAAAGKVVCAVAFDLMPSNPPAVRACLTEILKRRAWLGSQPSAGSVFRNPAGDFAGRLLEQAGMKGRSVGGARVLDEHANVIVTAPGATASDVRALLEIMRQAVYKKNGIELSEEIVCLDQ